MRTDQFELHDRIERDHWWFVARRRILAAAIRARVPAGATLIDIGCGTGANIAALGEGYRCIGIDAAESALSYARDAYPNIQFIRATGPDETSGLQADAFLLADVLEHIEDDSEFLSNWCRLLRPGGHLFITVPSSDVAWSPHDTNHGHHRRYTPERLSAVWETLETAEVTLMHFNSRLYPLVRALRAYTVWRGHTVGEADTDLWVPPFPLNGVLESIFAGERRSLVHAIEQGGPSPYRRGVSLLAALRVGVPS